MWCLDEGDGKEKQASCILDVGVQKSLENVCWDDMSFKTRAASTSGAVLLVSAVVVVPKQSKAWNGRTKHVRELIGF